MEALWLEFRSWHVKAQYDAVSTYPLAVLLRIWPGLSINHYDLLISLFERFCDSLVCHRIPSGLCGLPSGPAGPGDCLLDDEEAASSRRRGSAKGDSERASCIFGSTMSPPRGASSGVGDSCAASFGDVGSSSIISASAVFTGDIGRLSSAATSSGGVATAIEARARAIRGSAGGFVIDFTGEMWLVDGVAEDLLTSVVDLAPRDELPEYVVGFAAVADFALFCLLLFAVGS